MIELTQRLRGGANSHTGNHDAQDSDGVRLSERVAVLVTAGENQAREACRKAGFEPVMMLSRHDYMSGVRQIRRDIARGTVSAVVIHSADWERQSFQPLLELAAALLPVSRCHVVVGDGGRVLQMSRAKLLQRSGQLPFTCMTAAAGVSREIWGFRRIVTGPIQSPRIDLTRGVVLAIWRGHPGTLTGGSVTHAAGMLRAFRGQGLRVGLVTMCEPPPQLAAAIDTCEIADPLPRAARLTLEVEEILLNRLLGNAANRLLRRLRPAFVYERYDGFLTCGLTLAVRHELPLVIEWNCSAAWDRRHWRVKQYRFKHVFDRFLLGVEEESLRRSVLVRAVSDRAAEMAVECGADPDHVASIPNAVDIDAIPAPAPPAAREGPVLGWVGSFGPWHGASVVIQALAQIPDARAVLVGEGAERDACMALARDLRVEDRIEWTGMLPHNDAVARISACDVLVSPHVPSGDRAFFGSPTKLFEFMAMGRPIVASELEQIGDVLEDGRTARLVRPGDVEDLVRGIRDVLARPDRGYSLGVAARDEVKARHTWDHRARQLVARLEALNQPSGHSL